MAKKHCGGVFQFTDKNALQEDNNVEAGCVADEIESKISNIAVGCLCFPNNKPGTTQISCQSIKKHSRRKENTAKSNNSIQ